MDPTSGRSIRVTAAGFAAALGSSPFDGGLATRTPIEVFGFALR